MTLMQQWKLLGAVLLAGAHSLAFGQAAASLATAEASRAVPAGTHATAAALSETQPPAPVLSAAALQKKRDDADLWQRVRRGFVMDELNSPLVLQQEQWYASRPDYIQRFVDRGSKYLHHIVEEVEKRGMPTEVALLPIIESAFNPQAASTAKASGMWQFIPSTGKSFGLKQDWMADNRRDVLLSTGAALDYLQKLHGMFNSWELAFAAYNCGEGCVSRAIIRNQRLGLPTDYLSLTLPNETRSYVPKLIAVKNIVLSPGSYGIELEAVENRPYFAKVEAPAKIDTNLAARLAEMPEAEFASLNPAFNRPVATSGTGYFLVPYEKAETFRSNLSLYRSLNGPMVSWQTVNAKRGESVDAIARRYGMTGSYLRATNGALREKKGKLTQPVALMVPNTGTAKMMSAAFDQKIALKAAQTPVTTPAQVAPATAPAPIIVASATEPVATSSSHRVQPGETLFSISQRYGASVEDIKALNNLKSNSVQSGHTLLISAGDASAVSVAATPAAPGMLRVSAPVRAAAPKAARKSVTYTIRPGDTLYAIAIKYAVDLDDLLRWNRLSAKTVLQPGNKIRVAS
ncbi:MAG: LysM peptidoglycan-binding domain-containing protein [Usitatibacteraceae bacterium]